MTRGPIGAVSAADSDHTRTGEAPGPGTVITWSDDTPHSDVHSNPIGWVSRVERMLIGTSPEQPTSGFVGLSHDTIVPDNTMPRRTGPRGMRIFRMVARGIGALECQTSVDTGGSPES